MRETTRGVKAMSEETECRKQWKQTIIIHLNELETLVRSDLWLDMITSDEAGEIALHLQMALEIAKAKANKPDTYLLD